MTTSLSPWRASSRSSTVSTDVGHGHRRLPHTSTNVTEPPHSPTTLPDSTDSPGSRHQQQINSLPQNLT
ncbi:hypothetical protein [Streptomyces sp. WAC00263]|uniref:hypothetical protein n=1 Tax=Streptomyces sp. WAC00263 TaxID=1917422 RepID=UPI001F50BFD5|nr:hypothetical protein [Streptomyces sp. WAC00263]